MAPGGWWRVPAVVTLWAGAAHGSATSAATRRAVAAGFAPAWAPPTTPPTWIPPPTNTPTSGPTAFPTKSPARTTLPPLQTETGSPQFVQADVPTGGPTAPPAVSTAVPTNPPSAFPTNPPSAFPTNPPTGFPTNSPTGFPTRSPVPDGCPPAEDIGQIVTDLEANLSRFDPSENCPPVKLNDCWTLFWEGYGRYFRCGILWELMQLPVPLGCNGTLEPGANFTLVCNDPTQCDAYVFLYHAPPHSSSTNGDLPATLGPDSGWQAGSCAPHFHLPCVSNCTYRMAAFRRVLAPGESVEVVIENRPGLFVVPALVPTTPCLNSLTEEQCDATRNQPFRASTCEFVDGVCSDNWCPQIPKPNREPGVVGSDERGGGQQCVPANQVCQEQ